MVKFPPCPMCGTMTYEHAKTCCWGADTPAKLADRVARRQGRKLPPVITKAAILDAHPRVRNHMAPDALDEKPNVRDVFEGPQVKALAFVFDQLADLGLGKTDQERPEWRPNPSR